LYKINLCNFVCCLFEANFLLIDFGENDAVTCIVLFVCLL
jgi:hypothetical protein